MSKDQDKDDKFRRADTGRYTTEEYAKKHPKTTVKESPPKPKKK